MTQNLNQILRDVPDAIVYVETEAMVLTVPIRRLEQLCAYSGPTFQWYIPLNLVMCLIEEAEFRLASNERNVPDYRIVKQTGNLSFYERIVDA